MQVPALVVAALERAPHQPEVVGPGRAHRGRVPDRQHVGGAVGEAHAGARRGGLHDRLGVVGHRVLEALVGGGDAAGRGVVVGAVVQAGAAAVGGVDHPGDQGGAVGAEDRLRRLDLELEPQRPGAQPEALLEAFGGQHHRLHLVDRGDLRQRDHEAVGQRAAAGELLEEQRQRPQPARAGGLLEALEPDAQPRRRLAGLDRPAQRRGRGPDVGVLPVVAPGAVAVLEVDPQVLDGLPPELLAHPAEQVRVAVDEIEQPALVLVDAAQCRLAVRSGRCRPGSGPRGRTPCAPAADRVAPPGTPGPARRRPPPAARPAPPSAAPGPCSAP